MAKAKVKDAEDAEKLKGKIKNMANIIEELSSSSGDAEEIVDSKLGEVRDSFSTQVDEIKKSLAEMEKKSGKAPKVKEELETMLKQLEDKMHPKFSELDEKITALSKVDNVEKITEALKKKEDEAVEAALAKEEVNELKSNINTISGSVADIREQLRALERLPIMERKLHVESVLDPEDIRKLERVVSAVDQMIPKKIVDEKLNLFMESSREFQENVIKHQENLVKGFEDQVMRLDKRVEILFKIQKSYSEILEKRVEELFTNIKRYFEPDFDQIKKMQSTFATKKELADFRYHIDRMNKKNMAQFKDIEKSVDRRAVRGEMDRFKKDFAANFEYIRDYLSQLNAEINGLKKMVVKIQDLEKRVEKDADDMRKMYVSLEKKVGKLDKKMDVQKSLVMGEFRTVVSEKRNLQDVLERQKEKAGDILRKLVDR